VPERQAQQLELQLSRPDVSGKQRNDRALRKHSALPRLSTSPDEAAEMLGVSRDYFDEHVIHELRVVRRGRRILIPLSELERWLDRAATKTGSLNGRSGKEIYR